MSRSGSGPALVRPDEAAAVGGTRIEPVPGQRPAVTNAEAHQ